VVATILAIAAPAHAEPMVLDRGEVYARLVIETDFAQRRLARPLSYAPDVWLGVTDALTLGVIHSSQSVDRIDAGSSFCVRELATRCSGVYRGSGVDLRMKWTAHVAWHARALLRDIDPVKPAVTAGALLRWTRGRYVVDADPYLRIGLGNRAAGNRDALVVPIWIGRRLGDHAELAIHTGIDGDLAVWRDGWHVPLGVRLQVTPARAIAFGIEAGFSSLLGPQNTGDQRALAVYAAYYAR
jgi:hypothetical protein